MMVLGERESALNETIARTAVQTPDIEHRRIQKVNEKGTNARSWVPSTDSHTVAVC